MGTAHLTVRQAAELLGVNRSRVHQIANSRGWPKQYVTPRLILLRAKDVRAELRRRKTA